MEVGIKANDNLSSLASEDVLQQTSSKVPEAGDDNIGHLLEETNVFGAEAAEAKRNDPRNAAPHAAPRVELERLQEGVNGDHFTVPAKVLRQAVPGRLPQLKVLRGMKGLKGLKGLDRNE